MVATNPIPPNVQMADDAVALLSEKQKLTLAFKLIVGSELSPSIPTLMRIAQVADATSCELQARRMADEIVERTCIDPDFMAVFLAHYNLPSRPSIAMAYRHSVLEVSAKKITCHVASQEAVVRAMRSYHCPKRGAVQ